jgi:hypothetical protein
MYTLAQLVSGAYYESGVVARGLQAVSGPQASDGLMLFNEILVEKSMDTVFLPYLTEFTMDLEPQTETYFVSGLRELATLTFNIGNVRFPLDEMGVKEYNATGRVDNVSALPVSFWLQRVLGGMNIKLYPLPASTYVLNILGKFDYPQVSNYEIDLDQTYDDFQILYFKFKLAYRILLFNKQPVPQTLKEQLDNLERRFHDLSGQDWSIQKISTVNCGFYPNYMQVALKDGWRPRSL